MSSASQRLQQLALNPTANVVIDGKKYDTYTEPPKALGGERAKTKFDVRELTYFLDGGKDSTEKNETVMEMIERDPIFENDDFYDLSKDETRVVSMARVGKICDYILAAESEKDISRRLSLIGLVDPGAYTRIGVHFGLFLSGVRGGGTAEQLSYWISKGAGNLKQFFGCFAMTEIGHGSNVAGLETTATFDEATDEFIINTPHLAATKWWIGGAAHTATHTLCYARLIVKGKDYGVKNFVVPLRNIHDHSLKPGIAVGDIGKKFGRDGIDNGWIQFSNVRIPRQFMLMKYNKIDSQGNVTQPPLAQLAYGALIGGRVSMVSDSFQVSKRFLTIAIRYAAARRQFSAVEGTPETKILDYTYHQRRLLPRLAYAYGMRAAAEELYDVYYSATDKLASTSTSNKAELQAAIEDVKELFSLSAGLKAFSTWGAAEIIDQTRQACGGHGYSGYNGFGQGYADWVVNCTWEGDNNILTLSAGRSLIQSGLQLRKGNRVGSAVGYLNRLDSLKKAKLNGRDILDPKVIQEAWESVSAQAIDHTVDQFVNLTEKKGLTASQAFEELSQQRFEIARIHTRNYVVRAFFDKIAHSATPGIKETLTEVALLFALWSIENDSSLFLKYGFFNSEDLDKVTEHVNTYCKKVREQAIGLTDAFNLSDFFINAPIGNFDGDVYKHYFNKVVRRNPSRDAKPHYYESSMRPFLFREEDPEIDVSELEED
ncbi:acyl-CoA oxidase [Sugiyamaella lignohabitans]|uniref:Acyl-coenzyme A oxidase n=1 Tax=Sugiyamaella lignohabitans TaxID=796027 RepID=A0A167F3K6_9ASCO|nr:acyl-CoA oxidase [Sugiyamaella lignohabitans]ANB14784.1 acyl-CoA oxidase [Sugiyamaella lignohabitans]